MPSIAVIGTHTVVRDSGLWPKLSLRSDGRLFVTFYNQPSHGKMPGDIECWSSEDGGLLWSFCGRVSRHMPETAHLNHAMGFNGQGHLVVVAGGWSYRKDPESSNWIKDRLLRPKTWFSEDDGHTWKKMGAIPKRESTAVYVPFGKIETGPDGSLNVSAFIFRNDAAGNRRDTACLFRSMDDGASWITHGIIHPTEANETDILHVGRGRWLAAARNVQVVDGEKAHAIDLHQSENDGVTWVRKETVTEPRCHPAHLLQLLDGRLLLTFGDRRVPESCGIGIRLTGYKGTWESVIPLIDSIPTRDSGYPSTVQFPDGSLATAYYAAAGKDDPGYRLQIMKWRLDS